MIFVPPSFFQGRRLRPCFNGVDAPEQCLLIKMQLSLKKLKRLLAPNSVTVQVYNSSNVRSRCGPTIGNGICRIEWSRDRWRHVTRCERAALRASGGGYGFRIFVLVFRINSPAAFSATPRTAGIRISPRHDQLIGQSVVITYTCGSS